MNIRRRRRMAIAGAMGALLTPLLAAGASSASSVSGTRCPATAVEHLPNGWTRIAAPSFTAGGTRLAAYAVRPERPVEMYATNGTAIARSTNGGCSWEHVFALGAEPSAAGGGLTAASSTVTALYAPGAGRTVYAIAVDGPRLHVMRSSDSGTTWRVSAPGPVAPPADGAAELLVSRGRAVHLVTGRAAARAVYTSTDDGETWQPSPLPLRVIAAAQDPRAKLADLAVDPADPNVLLAATGVGLVASPDGGATWHDAGLDGVSGIDDVSVASSYGRLDVVAVAREARTAFVGSGGGDRWSAVTVPEGVDDVAVSGRAGAAVVAAPDGLFRIGLASAGIAPAWEAQPRLTGVAFDDVAAPAVYACACDDGPGSGIYRRRGPLGSGETSLDPPADPPSLLPESLHQGYQCSGSLPPLNAPTYGGTNALVPGTRVLQLSPGESVTVPYRLRAAPRRLDVFFLAESGAKMEYALCPFQTGAALAANSVGRVRDLRVGVGEYRDYPGQTDDRWGGDNGGLTGFTYARRAPVGLPSAALPSAVRMMRWRLGPDAAGASAIYQAVTGAGQDLGPSGPSIDDIRAGQQANFAADAFKVVFVVTGKWFNDPVRSVGYPGVPLDRTIAELKASGVRVAGIWINNVGNKQGTHDDRRFDGYLDLRRFSRESGAVAPAAIDCNGDGHVDIAKGDALVCGWLASESTNSRYSYMALGNPAMALEMERVLLALRDPQPLRLTVTAGAGAVSSVRAREVGRADALRRNARDFDVTFRCGARQTNQTVPVTLAGQVGDRTIAQAQVTVQCGRAVAPAPPARPAVAAPPLVPAAPQPLPHPGPAPGAQPVPHPAANPAPAGQAQAQAQPVAQGAVVPQEQAEPQLAFERARNALQQDEAMSALDGERDPLRGARRTAVIGGACLVAIFAAARRALAQAYEQRPRPRSPR